MNKSQKKAKAAKARVSAKLATLIASAGSVGFAASGAFENAVILVRNAVKALPRGANPLKHQGMIDLGLRYKGGYIARRLLAVPAYAKRWGNLDEPRLIDAALEIYDKPGFESGKPNRRTEEEHKACRAADTSFTKIRERAGIVSERKGSGGRKPRPSANKKPEPPRDLVQCSPKFTNDNEARDYMRSAFAALAATCEVNQQTGIKKDVKHVAFVVQSIILDAKAAIEKALA